MQQKAPEAKERYQLAKKEAKRVLRSAQNEEWAELGRSVQNDFQKNEKKFWSRVKGQGENGQMLEKCVMEVVKLCR